MANERNYRESLADKLRSMRNSTPKNLEIGRAMAKGYLLSEKEQQKYQTAIEENQKRLEKFREWRYMTSLPSIPADERYQRLLEEGELSKCSDERKRKLLEGMRAIDIAYADGIVIESGKENYNVFIKRYHKYKSYYHNEEEIKADLEIDDINTTALHKHMENLQSAIYGMGRPTDIIFDSKTGLAWVTLCDGENHFGGINHPTDFECFYFGRHGSDFQDERIKRLRKTLERFRRPPEQLEAYRIEKVKFVKEKADKKRIEEYGKFNFVI